MNGSLVLLLLSLLAQSGIEPLGINRTNTPGQNDRDHSAGVTQYGWQLNADNELEYLIQISPDMLPFMTSTTNQKEFQSEIPPELVGRIQRVVVSIGTQVLPRRPSLEEIKQMVPAIASLPGRFRDLEPDAQVTNVTNNQFPEPPANLGGATGNPAALSANGPSAPSTPLGGAFLDQARAGNLPANSPPGRSTLPANLQSPFGSSAGQDAAGNFGMQRQQSSIASNNRAGSTPPLPPSGRFSDTAAQPSAGTAPGGYSAQTSQSSLDRTGWQNSGTDPSSLGYDQYNSARNTTQGVGASYPPQVGMNPEYGRQLSGNTQPNGWATQGFGQPSNFGQQEYSQQAYDAQSGYGRNGVAPPQQNMDYDRRGPAFTSAPTGFGNNPGTYGQSMADRSLGADRWPNAVNSAGQVGRPGDTLIAARPRDSMGDGESSANFPSATGNSSREALDSHSGMDRGQPRESSPANPNTNYSLFVFFVLSVAVNLWMVHLLRSLYMRYRTLLSSLRGQTA